MTTETEKRRKAIYSVDLYPFDRELLVSLTRYLRVNGPKGRASTRADAFRFALQTTAEKLREEGWKI